MILFPCNGWAVFLCCAAACFDVLFGDDSLTAIFEPSIPVETDDVGIEPLLTLKQVVQTIPKTCFQKEPPQSLGAGGPEHYHRGPGIRCHRLFSLVFASLRLVLYGHGTDRIFRDWP